MAYIGNPPADRYSSVSYQDLTGGTGTSFTLDYAVGSANEIEVFVNNVRQEPSVAYTVAGTALTMTGSIASTDDFYVVFQSKAQQTVTHPATHALEATDGTFSGNVTADLVTGQSDSSSITTGLVVKNNNTTADNGMRLDFMSKDTSDNDIVFGRIETVVKNHTTEKADLNIQRYNDSGTFATAVQFNKDGYAKFEGGITFNGDTASANALDDYEEGSFTPTYLNQGTATYSTQVGLYVKIGRMVLVQVHTDISALGTASGQVILNNLPFTAISFADGGSTYGTTGTAHCNNWSNGREGVQGLVGYGSSQVAFYYRNSNSMTAVTHADMSTGNFLWSVYYMTAT